MKPIIIWELKQRKNYLAWWCFGTVSIITILLLIYPSIRSQAEQLNSVLNQLPPSLRELKTGGTQVDIASPIGYLNSQLYYVTLPLILIMMAIGLGSSLLARDEQNRTLELLLARPISRNKLLAAKALSGILLVLVVSFMAMITVIILSRIVDMQIGLGVLLLVSCYAMLFSMSFGAIAFALSAASNLTRRASIGVAAVLSFGGYVIASLSNLSDYLENPVKLIPYHYYNPTQILEGNIPTGLNLYLIGVIIITSLVSWAGFRRRDIN